MGVALSFNGLAASTKSSKGSKSSVKASQNSSVNSGVSQGLSLREALTLNQKSPWSYSANTASFRSLDQYDDVYWAVGGDISYKIKKNQSIAASLSYFETMDKFDQDPERYGFSDLDVSWLLPFIWRNPTYGNLSASFTVTAPLSERSQRETFVGGFTSSASLRKPLAGKLKFLTLSASGSVVLNHFTFDKSDVFGTDTNSPFGISTGVAAVSRFYRNIFWTNSYGVYNRLDYNSEWRTIQTLSSSLSLLLNQKLRIYGQYRWRDRVVTNDAFLDDDKSRVTVGGSYFF